MHVKWAVALSSLFFFFFARVLGVFPTTRILAILVLLKYVYFILEIYTQKLEEATNHHGMACCQKLQRRTTLLYDTNYLTILLGDAIFLMSKKIKRLRVMTWLWKLSSRQ
jgi:hypothetical protein